ncbi:MAG: hypothetical protein EZS28_015580 [Streblomastix strix]|uniref:CCR4-NOT transcription complex subunit 10 n=1 Tax=Streblomastix strix TaxID=222440 RepID=A0A5J4W2F9_9EUKA|nr:MAG: hypothetical protein EZS28_015580 [Streblomastix strix]
MASAQIKELSSKARYFFEHKRYTDSLHILQSLKIKYAGVMNGRALQSLESNIIITEYLSGSMHPMHQIFDKNFQLLASTKQYFKAKYILLPFYPYFNEIKKTDKGFWLRLNLLFYEIFYSLEDANQCENILSLVKKGLSPQIAFDNERAQFHRHEFHQLVRKERKKIEFNGSDNQDNKSQDETNDEENSIQRLIDTCLKDTRNDRYLEALDKLQKFLVVAPRELRPLILNDIGSSSSSLSKLGVYNLYHKDRRAEILGNCGIVLLSLGHMELAFYCLEEAVLRRPRHALYWLRLGECCIAVCAGEVEVHSMQFGESSVVGGGCFTRGTYGEDNAHLLLPINNSPSTDVFHYSFVDVDRGFNTRDDLVKQGVKVYDGIVPYEVASKEEEEEEKEIYKELERIRLSLKDDEKDKDQNEDNINNTDELYQFPSQKPHHSYSHNPFLCLSSRDAHRLPIGIQHHSRWLFAESVNYPYNPHTNGPLELKEKLDEIQHQKQMENEDQYKQTLTQQSSQQQQQQSSYQSPHSSTHLLPSNIQIAQDVILSGDCSMEFAVVCLENALVLNDMNINLKDNKIKHNQKKLEEKEREKERDMQLINNQYMNNINSNNSDYVPAIISAQQVLTSLHKPLETERFVCRLYLAEAFARIGRVDEAIKQIRLMDAVSANIQNYISYPHGRFVQPIFKRLGRARKLKRIEEANGQISNEKLEKNFELDENEEDKLKEKEIGKESNEGKQEQSNFYSRDFIKKFGKTVDPTELATEIKKLLSQIDTQPHNSNQQSSSSSQIQSNEHNQSGREYVSEMDSPRLKHLDEIDTNTNTQQQQMLTLTSSIPASTTSTAPINSNQTSTTKPRLFDTPPHNRRMQAIGSNPSLVCLELQPTFFVNAAAIHALQGDLKKAAEFASKAQEISPTLPHARLAALYVNMRKRLIEERGD